MMFEMIVSSSHITRNITCKYLVIFLINSSVFIFVKMLLLIKLNLNNPLLAYLYVVFFFYQCGVFQCFIIFDETFFYFISIWKRFNGCFSKSVNISSPMRPSDFDAD